MMSQGICDNVPIVSCPNALFGEEITGLFLQLLLYLSRLDVDFFSSFQWPCFAMVSSGFPFGLVFWQMRISDFPKN